MTSIRETAGLFFDACETGKGWDGCAQYCQSEATFSAQTGALEGVIPLQGYTDWMKGLLTIAPGGTAEICSLGSTRCTTTWPYSESFAARTPVRAVRYRRPARASRPTTST